MCRYTCITRKGVLKHLPEHLAFSPLQKIAHTFEILMHYIVHYWKDEIIISSTHSPGIFAR